MFLTFPECLAGLLFTERFNDTECLWIVGVTMMSEYTGYGQNLKFIGAHHPDPKAKQKMDSEERFESVICAIDALKWKDDEMDQQFRPDRIFRELAKACSGFQKGNGASMYDDWEVTTGKWGCGAFNGDKILKFVIQWIACSVCDRKMNFMTMMDIEFRYQKKLVRALKDKTVSEVVNKVVAYSKALIKMPDLEQTLFEHLVKDLDNPAPTN